MRFERIGAQWEKGIKIILDNDETALLYSRLSEKGSAEGRMLIAAILAAAQSECPVQFTGNELNVEILDSPSGAVIYISEIKPYYYLSPRRRMTFIGKSRYRLLCFFENAEMLLRFIKMCSCTFLCNDSEQISDLYSDGASFIIALESTDIRRTGTLLSEFGTTFRRSAKKLSEEYEIIISKNAVRELAELLNGLSP